MYHAVSVNLRGEYRDGRTWPDRAWRRFVGVRFPSAEAAWDFVHRNWDSLSFERPGRGRFVSASVERMQDGR